MEEKRLGLEDLLRLQREAEAYPFVCDGWEYSGNDDLKSIRFKDPRMAYWPIRSNIRFALRDLGLMKKQGWAKQFDGMILKDKNRLQRTIWHIRSAWGWLRFTQDNLPDGVVDKGIITFWEEAGRHVAAFSPDITPELTRLAIAGWRAENPDANGA